MKDRKLYFHLDELEKYGLFAIYTTKEYGNVMEISRDRFITDFKFENKKIVAGHQTHSDNIAIIEKDSELYFENTDGFLTQRKDMVIFTKYADCLPIYMYDVKNKVIGVVHSGWQGSFKEIGIKGIKLMKERFGSVSEDIMIAFGIGISQECYEVGQEFVEKFLQKFDNDIVEKSFIKKDGKIYFDNQKFNYLNFLNHGLKKENIITNNLCTYKGNFHSYRRDREKSGRNGAFICFK